MKNTILAFLFTLMSCSVYSQEAKCECFSKSGVTETIGLGGHGSFRDYTQIDTDKAGKLYYWYASYIPNEELCFPTDNWWQEVKAKIADAVESHPVYFSAKQRMPEMYQEKPGVANAGTIRQSDIDKVIKTSADQNATLIIIDANLISKASAFQKCSEIEKKIKKESSSKSQGSSSKSKETERKKVISKEEYDQYRVNISNHKFVNRIKSLELKGYSSGQAQVMADYERDNRNNEAIVNDVGNALGSVISNLIGNGSKRINNKFDEWSGDEDFKKEGSRINIINLDLVKDINEKYSAKNSPEDIDDIKQFIMEYYLLMGNRTFYHNEAFVEQKLNNIYFEGNTIHFDFEFDVVRGIDDNNHLAGKSSRKYYNISGTMKNNLSSDTQEIKINLIINNNSSQKTTTFSSTSELFETMPFLRNKNNSYDLHESQLSILTLIHKPTSNLLKLFDKIESENAQYSTKEKDKNFNNYLETLLPNLNKLRNKKSEKIEPVLIDVSYGEKISVPYLHLAYIKENKYFILKIPISFEGIDWMNSYKRKITNAPLSYYSMKYKKKDTKIYYSDNYYKPYSRATYGIGGKSKYDVVMHEDPVEVKLNEVVNIYTYAIPFLTFRSTNLKTFANGEPSALHKLKSGAGYDYQKLLSPKIEFGTFKPMINFSQFNEYKEIFQKENIENNLSYQKSSTGNIVLNLENHLFKNEFAIIRLDQVYYSAQSSKSVKLYVNSDKKSIIKDKYVFIPDFLNTGYISLPLEGKQTKRFNDIKDTFRFLKDNISKSLSISNSNFENILDLPHNFNDQYFDAEGYTTIVNLTKLAQSFYNFYEEYTEVKKKLTE